MYAALIKAKIYVMLKTAMKMQGDCDYIYTEIIVMIESFDGGESGEQLEEKKRYKREMEEEWNAETERNSQYRAYLSQMADRLFRNQTSSHRHHRAEGEECGLRWQQRRDLDLGPITWRNKLYIFIKGSTEGGRATEHLKQTSLQSKLDPFWYERITQANKKINE